MINDQSESASDNVQILKTESMPEEYEIHDDEGQKSEIELIKSFEEDQMGKNDLYEMKIRNDIALNLYQSLYKLKRGENDERLFKSPCQIKIYPTLKLMVIYLMVNFNFLRIKTELSEFKENEELENKEEKIDPNKFVNKSGSQLSSIINLNNEYNGDKINSNIREIIFTIELIDLFYMLDMLLCENKDYPIILSIDKDLSILTGKVVCPDIINQMMNSNQLKFSLLKNEAFSYTIIKPDKINSSNKREANKNDERNEKNVNNINNENNNDEDNEIAFDNDSSQINSSESKNVKINNDQEKSNLKPNYDSESEFLEKQFMTGLDDAKYIIEGSDLVELYYFMKGLDSIYNDNFTQEIGISMCNEKTFFFCPNLKNIYDGRYYEILSKNINQQIKLNIKCVKDHFLTPFINGFNSFYRVKFISKFITSFYNKDDKRLLVKVSTKGKMILSYTFSDPRNDMAFEEKNNQDTMNKKSISEEIKFNLDNEDDEEGESTQKMKRRKLLKDRLIDDENRGNIVEMIFYPIVFDLCKNNVK